jgi:sialate O-acetylesterase
MGFASLVAGWLLAVPTLADVRLPAVIGENMVLQCDMPAPVWGWADQGEEVTVRIAGQSKSVKTPQNGKWMLKLDPMPVGGPFTMTVAGENTLSLQGVLVGEVWVCSGQSNMQMAVRNCNNAEEEIAAAKYPRIRLLTVPLLGTQEPQEDFNGNWVECSPETVGGFSAAGYFFGRELYNRLDVPIGLIHCSWGGSACEAWVKRSALESDPQYKPLLERWDEIAAGYDAEKVEADYQKQVEAWKTAVAAAKAEGKTPPAAPRKPSNSLGGQHRPANLYNGMLLPLIPYAIRGAIWYQGETNASRAYQYRSLFPLMIESWRKDWNQGDFPFYFVQLANFKAVTPEPGESDWAELREAQSMTLKAPNTGQAVIIDVGEANNIHPKDKQAVGNRLALWALAKDYGKDVVFSGPTCESMKKEGGTILLRFGNLGGGLAAKDGPLRGFAIAGADKKFVWADARIDGDAVVVSSPDVPDPVAVRYAWADNPVCNLYNEAGLPASPFRTDDWPGITVDNR